MTLSDWYHDQMQDLIPQFLAKSNPSGAEPVPNAALMNETQNFTVAVEPSKTYMFRVINIGAFAGQYLWFEGHTMRIVEVDGVYTKPKEADMIYISAAQRVSFLLTTKDDSSANFPIVTSMDTVRVSLSFSDSVHLQLTITLLQTLFDQLPPELNYNATGWLTYDSNKDKPAAATVSELNPLDDMTLEPYDEMDLLPEPDHQVELNVIMDNLRDGKNYAFFNNITYTMPKVPTLYSVLSSGDDATNPAVYGTYTNSFVLEKDQIVQIVVNNLDSGRHPFHLHGHHFQAIYRSKEEAGTFGDEGVKPEVYTQKPMRRDTLVVWPNGNMVLRFKTDNPGVWLFHCHIEWHVVSGLLATFVEAPLELQKQLTLPADHLAACAADGILTEGNAAGNKDDFLDLAGQNVPSRSLPAGLVYFLENLNIALHTDLSHRFTTRGIVAFVFSCITGILGVLVVAWYGMSQPVKSGAAKGPFGEAIITNEDATTASTSEPVNREAQHPSGVATSRE